MRSAFAGLALGQVAGDFPPDPLYGVVHRLGRALHFRRDLPIGQAIQITGEDLGLQGGEPLTDRLLQRGEILLMDDDVLGVLVLVVCRAKKVKS